MDVFALRDQLVKDYRHYAESFLTIKDDRIRDHVAKELDQGLLWPDPALQLNPAFESGGLIDELVVGGMLNRECSKIFRVGKEPGYASVGAPLRLHKHQADAIKAAATGGNYVLTTGTGSGKSLAYIVPIVDHVLRARQAEGAGAQRIRAIVVYPMNALANSQEEELRKFLQFGYPDGNGPVTFRRSAHCSPSLLRSCAMDRSGRSLSNAMAGPRPNPTCRNAASCCLLPSEYNRRAGPR